MRRSAAPSCQSAAKRLRFLSPFLNSEIEIDKENEIFSIPKLKRDHAINVPTPKNSEDLSSTMCKENPINTSTCSTDEILKLLFEPIQEADNEHIDEKHTTSIGNDVFEAVCNSNISTLPFSTEGRKSLVQDAKHEVIKLKCDQVADLETTVIHYSVLWCKRSAKKHKVWEGDGILAVKNRSAILKNASGKVIDRGIGYKLKEIESLQDGSKFYIGGKECEIQYKIPPEECQDFENSEPSEKDLSATQSSSKSSNMLRKFCSPSLKFQTPIQKTKIHTDSLHENDLVLPQPTVEHQLMYNKGGLPITDVKVDTFLMKQLRSHQKEGIIFMYKCILGFQHEYGHGSILADEMGLGKTLQCIGLIWTLYKQGPYGGKPILKRVIIITPSSLVTNWKKEFHKWLGESRLSIFSVDKKHTIKDFLKTPKSVLIISYEMFLRSAELLSPITFDLVVCDEGHRIKNINIKISNVVNCLSTSRRILLTGTPIQNDLAEFFSIVDFVNPGALGSIQSFRRSFEKPIMQSRNQECTEVEKEIGENQSEELNRMAALFMLRRTQEVINQYLPSKSEIVVFCHPTDLQKSLYKLLLNTGSLWKILTAGVHADPSLHLIYISILRKLCNHPWLLYNIKNLDDHILSCLQSSFPVNYHPSPYDSGKMKVLEKILAAIFACSKNEKIVIVSGFTQTLNLIEDFCKSKNYHFLRLDGSTATSSRQDLVDVFNKSYTKYSIFLLSSKAGGVGFNLIGASRILLYDIDWNPANDLQAMARIWRDGQKHSVYIYRLLTTGTIEEKIYQRQVSKQCLSGSVLNPNSKEKLKFSSDELKDLFTFHEDTECLTHDLINCQCLYDVFESEKKEVSKSISQNIGMEELMSWKHICGPISEINATDFTLASGGSDISFLFVNKTNSPAS